MEALPQNLFQLMLQLSKIQSRKKIVETFIESMNAIFTEIRFSEAKDSLDSGFDFIDIKTSFNYYGRLILDYGQKILPVSKRQLIHNAVDMLAILIENRSQQEKLTNEKKQLKKEWLKQLDNIHVLDGQYKILAENSEDMIIRFDRSLNIIYANHCTEKIFDLPRILFISKNINDLDLSEEQSEFWSKNLERVFRIGFSMNENLVISGIQKHYYHVKFVPEKADSGEVNFVIATARDITDLKNKEKALFESQWHLKQAQRIAKIGSWEWNLKYDTISLSDELYHMVGLPPLHRNHTIDELKSFVTEGLFTYVKKFQQDPPEDMKTFEIEVNVRRVDGTVRHCVICGETIIGNSGKIKKIHGTIQDITERKIMESELKNAKLKAEESDRLKSAFLANMSHEIRTPLNGILGFSELLKHKNLNAEKRQFYIDIICSNGKQLLNVISDIIDISRIESGQITIDKSSFCPETLLNDLHEHLKTELKAKGKPKIETRQLPDVRLRNASIVADEIHLKQILVHLISNAVKFTNSGQICLGYEIREDNIEFFVTDTGIGIQADCHKLIFERFRQANESASREHGGTGLGLAICKNLVELMGGKIWVISLEGKGSEFRFSLPFVTSVQVENRPVESKGFEYSWPGKKILIVEDDNASMELLNESLAETYAIIYKADDGEKALLMHKNIQPDIILMDIRMPNLNGLDAIQIIRKTDPAVPIIAITANAFVEDKISCKAAGADDYISKPVDQSILLSKMEKFLGQPLETFANAAGEEAVKK